MSASAEAGPREQLAGRRHRADAHDPRRDAGAGHRDDPRDRLESLRAGRGLGGTSSAAAPSLTPDALPAVTEPPWRNGVGKAASCSSVVSGRGCSSRSTSCGSPRRCGTATAVISSASRPSAIAVAARCCERSAKAS